MSDSDDFLLFQEFQKWKAQQRSRGDAGGPDVNRKETVSDASESEEEPNTGEEECGEGSTGDEEEAGEGSTGDPKLGLYSECPRPPLSQEGDIDQDCSVKSGGNSPSLDEAEPTAQDYLSKASKKKGCKSSKAAKDFQHVLRDAISEADVWGCTLKQLKRKAAHKKYIHDKVIKECPALEGHTRDIDIALARTLANARYSRKAKSKISKVNAKSDMASLIKSPTQKLSGKKQLKGRQKDVAHSSTFSLSGKKKKDDTRKGGKKGEKKGEPKGKARQMSETKKNKKKDSTKKVDINKEDTNLKDVVMVLHDNRPIARALYMSSIYPGMYCRLKFINFLDACNEEEIELPGPCSSESKTSFTELTEGDEFTWKSSKIQRPKRQRASNSLLNDYIKF